MIKEVELNEEVLALLIKMSKDWENENSCYGYRANQKDDIEGNRIFLAYEKDEVVGYLFGHEFVSENMTSVIPNGKKCFEVMELFVDKQMRSKGIGKQLMNYAENELKKNYQYVLLSTATKNSKAILHFYIDEVGMTLWSARLFKKLS